MANLIPRGKAKTAIEVLTTLLTHHEEAVAAGNAELQPLGEAMDLIKRLYKVGDDDPRITILATSKQDLEQQYVGSDEVITALKKVIGYVEPYTQTASTKVSSPAPDSSVDTGESGPTKPEPEEKNHHLGPLAVKILHKAIFDREEVPQSLTEALEISWEKPLDEATTSRTQGGNPPTTKIVTLAEDLEFGERSMIRGSLVNARTMIVAALEAKATERPFRIGSTLRGVLVKMQEKNISPEQLFQILDNWGINAPVA